MRETEREREGEKIFYHTRYIRKKKDGQRGKKEREREKGNSSIKEE